MATLSITLRVCKLGRVVSDRLPLVTDGSLPVVDRSSSAVRLPVIVVFTASVVMLMLVSPRVRVGLVMMGAPVMCQFLPVFITFAVVL